ncbi:hypothetical protein CMUS01_13675 [Colletotrichum musicola]|uniref:Uncharacterized protein n=1 Tax=Colletotrichum musicola TaxID=2175873 RepID=A0A8H6JBE7_9PEZI|nr:hypothetical protein CMUS01_13675 [Colletotrichum musicola]
MVKRKTKAGGRRASRRDESASPPGSPPGPAPALQNISAADTQVLRDAEVIYLDRKRKHSELSVASTVGRDHKQLRTDAAAAVIQALLEKQEAALEGVRKTKDVVIRVWSRGFWTTTASAYSQLRTAIEERINRLLAEVSTLRTKRSEMAGALMDAPFALERERLQDFAFINLLLSKYLHPHGVTASIKPDATDEKRERFRKRLIKAYASLGPDHRSI